MKKIIIFNMLFNLFCFLIYSEDIKSDVIGFDKTFYNEVCGYYIAYDDENFKDKDNKEIITNYDCRYKMVKEEFSWGKSYCIWESGVLIDITKRNKLEIILIPAVGYDITKIIKENDKKYIIYGFGNVNENVQYNIEIINDRKIKITGKFINGIYYRIGGPKKVYVVYPKYITPIVDNLRLRGSPSLEGKFIRSLIKGEKLELIEEGNSDVIDIRGENSTVINRIWGVWIKIKTIKNEIGWCFDAYLKEYKD
jgi:hypothetical protein